MNKYILLDFDGVITSDSYTRKCIFEYRKENIFGMDWFDPACIAALSHIIDNTKADIIVSSSWRDLGMAKLKMVWEHIPMPGRLINTIPEWILLKQEAMAYWISKHETDRYIILDDTDYGLPNLVKTNPKTGLTFKDAELAISLLS